MKTTLYHLSLVTLLAGFIFCGAGQAEVTPHSLISNGAVLQQGLPVPIWGTARDGEKVTVKFQDQEVSTTAKNGRWSVTLKPLKAGGPFTMTITGDNKIELNDLLVGEVWICSGQSNMGWQLCQAANGPQEIAEANYPNIRFFGVPQQVSEAPQSTVVGRWLPCTPKTVAGLTAVGYFFGRELHKNLQVPIGLIESAVGGTPAEAWTSEPFLADDPALKPLTGEIKTVNQTYLDAQKAYEAALADWKEDNDKVVADGLPALPKPKAPKPPALSTGLGAGLYNGMIAPLIPYAVQGAIWYQGESNAGRAYQYRTLFPVLIKSWRSAWQRDLPFLFVQLANYTASLDAPGESTWAELREAQTMTLALPKTAMAVTIDIGEAGSIHPLDKQDVGHRLVLAAEATVYGQSIEFSGPMYQSMTVHDNKIALHFTHGAGLAARGDKLTGFAIAGADKKFVWADAKIDGDTVIVSSESIPNPVAVRYAWADNPICNLYNQAGLPASPFRTDDWPGITGGR